ncbi:nitroreductase family protein [Anaeromicropila populeti]|uniref:Nitroreductase family protein n=1 Tax=Anaeromicropila populeti TaxID=37658 RepID=A0A1I6JCH1_9FIRM|nr:nitroreductase family protein [Anaeromicropila populeti]SFR76648.1 Nitroreductase family protein [Anaeromicropila populeti]
MNLYDAIFMRKSVRNYKMEQLSDALLAQILNFSSHISVISDTCKVSFEIISTYQNCGHVGHYSVKAPYYFVLITDKDDTSAVNAGYIMEQVSLYMYTKELGSCFVGLHNLKKEFKLSDTQTAYVLAFGKAIGTPYRDSSKSKRAAIEEIAVFKEKGNENMERLLEAARLAPSGYNSQPWRFVVSKNRIHLFCKKEQVKFLKRYSLYPYDVGIALGNLMVAGEELWLNLAVKTNEAIAEKKFKNNVYMLTVLVDSQQLELEL